MKNHANYYLGKLQISGTFTASLHLSLNNHCGCVFSGHTMIFALCCVCLQVSELQKELTELEKCNGELEDYVEMRKGAQTEEISRLEV